MSGISNVFKYGFWLIACHVLVCARVSLNGPCLKMILMTTSLPVPFLQIGILSKTEISFVQR